MVGLRKAMNFILCDSYLKLILSRETNLIISGGLYRTYLKFLQALGKQRMQLISKLCTHICTVLHLCLLMVSDSAKFCRTRITYI